MEKTFKAVTNIASADDAGEWYLCDIDGKRWRVNVKAIGDLGESVRKAIDDGAEVTPFVPSYQEQRAKAYPAIGDQLDAIIKELNYRRMNGENLIAEMDSIVGLCLAVKKDYPKPEGA